MSHSPTFLARLEPPCSRFVTVVYPAMQTDVLPTDSSVEYHPEEKQDELCTLPKIDCPAVEGGLSQTETSGFFSGNDGALTDGINTAKKICIVKPGARSVTHQNPAYSKYRKRSCGESDETHDKSFEEDPLILKTVEDHDFYEANSVSRCLHSRSISPSKGLELNSSSTAGTLWRDSATESSYNHRSRRKGSFGKAHSNSKRFPARSQANIRLASPVSCQKFVFPNDKETSRQTVERYVHSLSDEPDSCFDSDVRSEDGSTLGRQGGEFVCFALVGQQENANLHNEIEETERKEKRCSVSFDKGLNEKQSHGRSDRSNLGLMGFVETEGSGESALRICHSDSSQPIISAIPNCESVVLRETSQSDNVKEAVQWESPSEMEVQCGVESEESKLDLGDQQRHDYTCEKVAREGAGFELTDDAKQQQILAEIKESIKDKEQFAETRWETKRNLQLTTRTIDERDHDGTSQVWLPSDGNEFLSTRRGYVMPNKHQVGCDFGADATDSGRELWFANSSSTEFCKRDDSFSSNQGDQSFSTRDGIGSGCDFSVDDLCDVIVCPVATDCTSLTSRRTYSSKAQRDQESPYTRSSDKLEENIKEEVTLDGKEPGSYQRKNDLLVSGREEDVANSREVVPLFNVEYSPIEENGCSFSSGLGKREFESDNLTGSLQMSRSRVAEIDHVTRCQGILKNQDGNRNDLANSIVGLPETKGSDVALCDFDVDDTDEECRNRDESSRVSSVYEDINNMSSNDLSDTDSNNSDHKQIISGSSNENPEPVDNSNAWVMHEEVYFDVLHPSVSDGDSVGSIDRKERGTTFDNVEDSDCIIDNTTSFVYVLHRGISDGDSVGSIDRKERGTAIDNVEDSNCIIDNTTSFVSMGDMCDGPNVCSAPDIPRALTAQSQDRTIIHENSPDFELEKVSHELEKNVFDVGWLSSDVTCVEFKSKQLPSGLVLEETFSFSGVKQDVGSITFKSSEIIPSTFSRQTENRGTGESCDSAVMTVKDVQHESSNSVVSGEKTDRRRACDKSIPFNVPGFVKRSGLFRSQQPSFDTIGHSSTAEAVEANLLTDSVTAFTTVSANSSASNPGTHKEVENNAEVIDTEKGTGKEDNDCGDRGAHSASQFRSLKVRPSLDVEPPTFSPESDAVGVLIDDLDVDRSDTVGVQQATDPKQPRDAVPLQSAPSTSELVPGSAVESCFALQEATKSPDKKPEMCNQRNGQCYVTENICSIEYDDCEDGIWDLMDSSCSEVVAEIPGQASAILDSQLTILSFEDGMDRSTLSAEEAQEPESCKPGDFQSDATSDVTLVDGGTTCENVIDEVVCSYEESSVPDRSFQIKRSPDNPETLDDGIYQRSVDYVSSDTEEVLASNLERSVYNNELTPSIEANHEDREHFGYDVVDMETQTDNLMGYWRQGCDRQCQTVPLSSFSVSKQCQVDLLDGRVDLHEDSSEEAVSKGTLCSNAIPMRFGTRLVAGVKPNTPVETIGEVSVLDGKKESVLLIHPTSSCLETKAEDWQTIVHSDLQTDGLGEPLAMSQTQSIAREFCNQACQTELIADPVEVKSKENQIISVHKSCDTSDLFELRFLQNEFELRTVQSQTELQTDYLIEKGCQVDTFLGFNENQGSMDHFNKEWSVGLAERKHDPERNPHIGVGDDAVRDLSQDPGLRDSPHSIATSINGQRAKHLDDSLEHLLSMFNATEHVGTQVDVAHDNKESQTSLDIDIHQKCSKECQTSPTLQFSHAEDKLFAEHSSISVSAPQNGDSYVIERPMPYGQSPGPSEQHLFEFLSSNELETKNLKQFQSTSETAVDDKSCQVLLCNCGTHVDDHQSECNLAEPSSCPQPGAAIRVSEGMQKEQESLIKQLDMLRDMNQKLRDDRDAIEAAHEAMLMAKKTKVTRQGSKLSKYVRKKRSPNPADTWGNQGSIEYNSSEDGETFVSGDRRRSRRRSKQGDMKRQGSVMSSYSSNSFGSGSLHDSIKEEAEFDGDPNLELLPDEKVEELERPTWAKKIMACVQPKEDEGRKEASEEELDEEVFRRRKAELISGEAYNGSDGEDSDVSLSEELSEDSGSEFGDRPRSPRAPPVGKDNEISRTGSQDFSEAGVSAISESSLSPERVFKVVFVGDSGVGKSSFIHRFCHDTWRASFTATIGVDFQIKTMNLDGRYIALQLWDTAGQERFRSITKQYFRKADGVIVFYDVTMATSFLNIKNWMISVEEGTDDGTAIMIVGNKTDLVQEDSDRAVKPQDGQRLAEEYKALYAETSAKTGHNIHEAMVQFSKILQVREDELMQSVLNLVTEQPKKKKCCNRT